MAVAAAVNPSAFAQDAGIWDACRSTSAESAVWRSAAVFSARVVADTPVPGGIEGAFRKDLAVQRVWKGHPTTRQSVVAGWGEQLAGLEAGREYLVYAYGWYDYDLFFALWPTTWWTMVAGFWDETARQRRAGLFNGPAVVGCAIPLASAQEHLAALGPGYPALPVSRLQMLVAAIAACLGLVASWRRRSRPRPR